MSYAVPTILGELKRHFRDKRWALRVPRSLQERGMEVTHAVELLYARLGRSPSPRDIAEETGLTLEEVLEAMDLSTAYSPTPLDAPIGRRRGWRPHARRDARLRGRRLRAGRAGPPVAPAFRALPEREQAILKLRFVDDLTQAEIAERIGISQMHVSRLIRRALGQLSEAAEA